MAELDQIISVSIAANSKTPTRQGFGTPLLLTYHTRFAERYRVYTDLAGMATDLFESYDDAYRAAAAVFSQNPAPEQVIVGRLPAAPSFVTKVTVTSAVEGQHVKFKVVQPATGTVTQIDYPIGAAETTTTVATAIELLTEAIPGVDSTSAVAGVSLTPTVAGRKVHVYDLENCKVMEDTGDAGYNDELTALQLENDDWYFVITDSASETNVDLVATWTLAQKKLYFVSTESSFELDGTGALGADLKAAANDRVAILYAPVPHQFGAAAWAGLGAAQTPGSITWAFKTLAGITPKTLTATERSNLETDNENHYQTVAGLSITRQGKVASGEFIDIRHGLDALEADIKESVFALLANSPKVPFTNKGLDSVANAIQGSLVRFEQSGLLVEGSSVVTMPALSSISTLDKAARLLANVKFSATLAGAIHKITIVGTVSV